MKICYEEYRPQAKALAIIREADRILTKYASEGYDLTLRQLFYQFVATNQLPNDHKKGYLYLNDLMEKARGGGLIDWDHIVDRTRELRENMHWDSPEQMVSYYAKQYEIDKWEDQNNRVEVWFEKDAVAGIVDRVCTELDVAYFSCRGYPSASAVWRAATHRLQSYVDLGQRIVILYLGDHDPTGVHINEDIQHRIDTFLPSGPCQVEVKRIALTSQQIKKYNLPPQPVKKGDAEKAGDSRAAAYIAEHGTGCWELDALEPAVIHALIEKAILQLRDERKWAVSVATEKQGRDQLQDVAEQLS